MRTKAAVVALVGAFAALALAGCEEKKTAEAPAPAFMIDDTWKGVSPEVLASTAQKVSKDLKDPASMQMRHLVGAEGKVAGLCGEMNAKNSLGGYVGFRPFFALEGHPDAAVLPDVLGEEGAVLFDRVLISVCPSWKIYASPKALVAEDADKALRAYLPPAPSPSHMPAPVKAYCNIHETEYDAYRRCTLDQGRAYLKLDILAHSERSASAQVARAACERRLQINGEDPTNFLALVGCIIEGDPTFARIGTD